MMELGIGADGQEQKCQECKKYLAHVETDLL